VDALRPGGKTFFAPAFNTAFPLFRNSQSSSNCSRLLLFLTDGYASDASAEVVMPTIRTSQALLSQPARIFTYSVGSTADVRLPRDIACANGGLWTGIQ